MAILSKLKDGLGFENDELSHVNHNVSCFHRDFSLKDGVLEECKGTLERLFDQVMPIYLREVSVGKIARPLPALLGEGQQVDLFRLFWVVKKKGGFNSVSESGLWSSVAEECFLSATLMSSLKMVYIKYLKEFDGWLRLVFRDKRSEDHVVEIFKKLDLLRVEAEQLKGLVWSDEYKKGDNGEVGLEFDDKSGSSVEINNGKHISQLSDGSIFNKVHHNKEIFYDETESCVDLGTCTSGLLLCNKKDHIVESSNNSEKDMCIQGGGSIMSSAKCVGNNLMSSKKIKLGLEVGIDKVQDKVEASRSDNDNEELARQDGYDILLSARSVVNKVISSMKSEFCSLPEVDNVQENGANTYDDDEKFHDDYAFLLSARRIADNVASSYNEEKNLWPRKGINEVRENAESIRDDCGKVCVQDDASVELSTTSVGNKVAVSRKRKWESTSLPEMLNWITEVAKRSDDPTIGIVPGPSKWNDHETDAYWMQALLARDALLIKRPIYSNFEVGPLQKKPKMHPSMYEDINALHQSAERVRCSKRIPLSKSQFCPCCNHGPASQSKVSSPRKAQTRDSKLTSSAEVPTSLALDASHKEVAFDRHVSVGLTYQAEVPEWTGAVSESDSKWLGKRVWAPEDENQKTLVEKHSIGKGRQSSCDCSLPGSPACVGLHIAEKRLQLKRDMGGLFYRWKFDRMGEEVSLSWTPGEEKRFKKMVLENTAVNKFWKNALRLFPFKTREKLVCYYFNVLVLRRRSYQNRVTPKNIDSDDDETDFGSVGGSAFLEGYNLPECSLSMQYTDLE